MSRHSGRTDVDAKPTDAYHRHCRRRLTTLTLSATPVPHARNYSNNYRHRVLPEAERLSWATSKQQSTCLAARSHQEYQHATLRCKFCAAKCKVKHETFNGHLKNVARIFCMCACRTTNSWFSCGYDHVTCFIHIFNFALNTYL